MASLSLTPQYTYISGTVSGISTVSYPRVFYWYVDGSLFSQDYIGAGDATSSVSASATGLSEGTTYTIEVIVENDNTGAVVATFSKSATTKEHTSDVVMGSCSISPTKIGAGQTVTLSWSYTGSASTSSYFDIYASQTPNFSTATLVNSVRPPTTSVTTTWGNPGTWYFWVVYRGNSSRTTNYATLQVTENAWKQSTVYIYANGWKPATPYIFTNGQWRPATAYIYKE